MKSISIPIILLLCIITGLKCSKTADSVSGLNITAGSTLSETESPWKYHPIHIMDGNLKSVWCDGERGYGIGTRITIQLDQPIKFNALKILNGFATSQKRAARNSSLRTLKITARLKPAGAGDTVRVELSRPAFNGKKPEAQLIKLKESLKGKYIDLEINNIHKGSHYKDTCLTELSFGNNKAGKFEFFPNDSSGQIERLKEKLSLARKHAYAFYALKYLSSEEGQTEILEFHNLRGKRTFRLLKNGTFELPAFSGTDEQNNPVIYEPAKNGAFTVKAVNENGVHITLHNRDTSEESLTVRRLYKEDKVFETGKALMSNKWSEVYKPKTNFVILIDWNKDDSLDSERYLTTRYLLSL